MWPTPVPTPTQTPKKTTTQTSSTQNYSPALNYSPATSRQNYTPALSGPGYGYYGSADVVPNYSKATGGVGYAPPTPTNVNSSQNRPSSSYTDTDPGGFGRASNPDLSNEYKKKRYEEYLKGATSSSEDAAKAAAEARRQAAYRAYEGKKQAAGVAKESAKSEYDWLVNTLGSNKKDLLDEVALNEKSGVDEYTRQEAKTKENYDKSRKEILNTYRDLNREQEKIMRGAGVSTSSRSMEAQLKLNNLLGKDLSELSTNEADSLAMIGTALATFKERVQLTKNSIETETKSKMDKAALDYNNQVKAIDLNLNLAADAREDAIAAADAQLAADTAEIQKWAAGIKLQVEFAVAQQAETLNDFIVDMTDSSKSLNTDLTTKQAQTQQFVQGISTAVTLDKEGNLTMPTGAGKKTTKTSNLASLYDPSKVGLAGTTSGAGSTQAGSVQNLSRDPLLSVLA